MSQSQSRAQDAYWGLDDNKVFNTYSRTVSAIPSNGVQLNLLYANPGARGFFNGDGNTLLTLGSNLYFHEGALYNDAIANSPGGYIGQIMPVPLKCRKYNVWTLKSSPGHTMNLYVSEVDVSGVTGNINTSTAPAVTGSTHVTLSGDAFFGAAAAPLNPDGTRYIYYLYKNETNHNANLLRFTVAADGSVNTTPTVLTSSLPTAYNYPPSPVNCRMQISPDGGTAAYVNVTGNLVTYRMYGTGAGTITTYPGSALACAQVTVGGARRWYVSTGSSLIYYQEGNTTAQPVSSTYGISSQISQGRDGNLYIAQGTPAYGLPGDLYYFNPSSGSPVFTAVSQAGIIGLDASNSYYVFGNHIPGENTNAWNTTPTPSFTLNGQSSGTITAYSCQPITLANLVPGASIPAYQILITQPGNMSVVYDSTGKLYGTPPSSIDLKQLSGLSPLSTDYLSNHYGLYDIVIVYYNPCGNTQKVFPMNLIQAGPITALDFDLNGKQQTGSSAQDVWRCSGPNSPLLLSITHLGTVTSHSVTVTMLPSNVSMSYNSGAFSPKDITGFLQSYDGEIKVTVIGNSPCGNSMIDVQHFDIKSSTAAIGFKMNAANCPPGFMGNALEHNLPIADRSFAGQTDLCGLPGWQGAISAGIFNVTINVTGIDSSIIRLIEVDPVSGAEAGPVLFKYRRLGAIPTTALFYSPQSSEVLTDMNPKFFDPVFYASLYPANRTFKTTVTAYTPSCPVSDSTYFRIAGGIPGSQFWNAEGSSYLQAGEDHIEVYPSPAGAVVNFELKSSGPGTIRIDLFDVTGKRVKTTSFDKNMGYFLATLEISDLTSGIYFYKVTAPTKQYKGKFTKE